MMLLVRDATDQLHAALTAHNYRILATPADTHWLVCSHQGTGRGLVVQLFADGGAVLWTPLIATHDLGATLAVIP